MLQDVIMNLSDRHAVLRVCGERALPSRMITHSRMASRAPGLRPRGRRKALVLQFRTEPETSHAQTRTLSVPVLLWMGNPLSSTTTGTSYTLFSIRLNPARLFTSPAVLSENTHTHACTAWSLRSFHSNQWWHLFFSV